ncbi:T9SS type A sorting domain-containing protein [candidate division KSB1 bacterium]|nr:T9SS type A sorting domain-containing protein [candidate division KSB1 bacterium]
MKQSVTDQKTDFFRGKMKNWIVCIVLSSIMLPILAFAGGTPHSVIGTVHNNDGSNPGQSDLTISVYITYAGTGDSNTLTRDAVNVLYGSETLMGIPWYEIKAEAFSGTWSIGDVMHISFTNTANGESSSTDVVLDASDPQLAGDTSLPVELSTFIAKFVNNSVILNWDTASEIDNSGFNLFRSTDKGNNFILLNTRLIDGAGTSSSSNSYSFSDKNVINGVTYYYKLESVSLSGTKIVAGLTSITIEIEEIPETFDLAQNYPNPFNPETMIRYSVAKQSKVNISIYNLLGQKLITLVNKNQAPGNYSLNWFGKDVNGNNLGTGIYILQMTADSFVQTRKIALIR